MAPFPGSTRAAAETFDGDGPGSSLLVGNLWHSKCHPYRSYNRLCTVHDSKVEFNFMILCAQSPGMPSLRIEYTLSGAPDEDAAAGHNSAHSLPSPDYTRAVSRVASSPLL